MGPNCVRCGTSSHTHDDEEDGEDEDDDAPGMLMDKSESRRWWEGSAGFDFQKSRTDKNKTDGMLVKGDPDGYVGKIVLRHFGRGVQSYGKVVGWFPEEEVGDGVLYHVLHGDGDEEDLDKVECRTAIREAEQEPDSDSDLDLDPDRDPDRDHDHDDLIMTYDLELNEYP